MAFLNDSQKSQPTLVSVWVCTANDYGQHSEFPMYPALPLESTAAVRLPEQPGSGGARKIRLGRDLDIGHRVSMAIRPYQ